MNELQLLNALNGLLDSSRLLSIQIQLWEDGSERNEFIQQRQTVNTNILELQNQLINIQDKTLSNRAKQNIIDQLRQYITTIGNRSHPVTLLRIEGINFENSLFSNLASRIKRIVDCKQMGIDIPDLYYTYGNQNNIEIDEFKDFINSEIGNIHNIENVNFIELKNYFESFQTRLINTFIK